MQSSRLFVHRLPAGTFEPWSQADGQWISRTAVVRVSVEPVGDVLASHVESRIELRFVPEIWSFWDCVVESGLPFSGVRLQNALPRVESDTT